MPVKLVWGIFVLFSKDEDAEKQKQKSDQERCDQGATNSKEDFQWPPLILEHLWQTSALAFFYLVEIRVVHVIEKAM